MSEIELNSPLLEWRRVPRDHLFRRSPRLHLYSECPTGLHFASASTLSSGDSGVTFRRSLWNRQWYRGTTSGTSSDLISLQYEIFRYFFSLDFISSYSSNSLLYYLSVGCSYKVSWMHYLLSCICRSGHYMWELSSQSIVLIFQFTFRSLLHVYNLFTIKISHYFKLITCSLDRSPLLVKRASFTLLLSSVYVHTRFTSFWYSFRLEILIMHV